MSKKDKKYIVLDEIRKHGNVSRAARVADISRRTVYVWRSQDRVFSAAVNEAISEALDETGFDDGPKAQTARGKNRKPAKP